MALLNTLGAAKWPITVHSAEGALVWDTAGRTYWDFYGGHAVTLIGQADPRWIEAITRQMQQLAFCTTVADVAIRSQAAEHLCRFTGMDVAWFVNSGAEANEGALKIARKTTGRRVIVAMVNGFHGRTMGALGATWGYRDQHAPAHGEVRFVPFGDLDALQAALDEDVAAVITEPVQGVAGVVVPPVGWLAAAKQAAHSVGALFICDEVQAGMGRMGTPLASQREGVQPDIVTLGKGLGGGFPVAAVLMSDAVAQTIQPGDHGTTFGGAPLACAAVAATLQIIEEDDLMEKASKLGTLMHQTLGALPGVRTRGAGAWIAVDLGQPAKPLVSLLRERGFLVGTAGDPHVLRLAPPATLPHCAVHQLRDDLADLLHIEAVDRECA